MTGIERVERDPWDVEASLRELGESVLPPGFDSRLKTYDEMMAAIATMPEEQRHQISAEVEQLAAVNGPFQG